MAIVSVTTPPDGAVRELRGEAVLSLGPTFSWSATVKARGVVLTHGQEVIVLDTADNVSAIRRAMDPAGGAVTPIVQAAGEQPHGE